MGSLYSITPFTLLDYPGEMACIAWFAGCNLRCVYCHNPDIVLGRGALEEAALLDFLRRRQGLLSGVVFSGGEATFCPSLLELARQVRALGYKIKLDTNGTRPEVLVQLWDEGLLDYVALDYKTVPGRAQDLLGTAKFTEPFRRSLTQLIAYAEVGLKLEVRTTYHADLMREEELAWIVEDLDRLKFRGIYSVQNIVSTGDKTLGGIATPQRQVARGLVPEPLHFKLNWRNFSTAV